MFFLQFKGGIRHTEEENLPFKATSSKNAYLNYEVIKETNCKQLKHGFWLTVLPVHAAKTSGNPRIHGHDAVVYKISNML